jgi:hypothetical protein
MSRYSETETSQAGDWLMDKARRHPEALLLLAAGACLLMRSGGNGSARPAIRRRSDWSEGAYSGEGGRRSSTTASNMREGVSNMREGVSRAADTAADYASDVKDRISETAAGYADSVSDFAGDAGRAVSERAERWQRQARSQVQGGVDRVLREQPLAVAVAGLAAGVAVAALLPATRMENQAFGGARDALADAAGKAGERMMEAAGKAGERLKEAADERGLSADGLKKMAGEVADAFTGEVKGKADTSGSGGTAPDRSGQNFGREQGARDHKPAAQTARSSYAPGTGNR